MMKTFYNIPLQLSALAVVLAVIFAFSAVTAAEHESVIKAVELARSQGISDETMNLLLAYSMDNVRESKHTARVIQLLVRIQKTGVLLAPFEDKIREAVVKRVGAQKLENALEQLFDDYRFVDSLMNDMPAEIGTNPGRIQMMFVKSLKSGLTRQELRDLVQKGFTAPPEMVAIAAQNKAFLKQIAFDDQQIDEILAAGLARQNFTSQWVSFYRLAAAARKKGLSDSQIAQAAVDALKQDGDLRQVLTSLSFSLRDVRHGPHPDSPKDITEER